MYVDSEHFFSNKIMAVSRKKPSRRNLEADLCSLLKVTLQDRDLRQKDLINALPLTRHHPRKKGSGEAAFRGGTYVKEIMSGKRVPELKYLIDVLIAIQTRSGSKESFGDQEIGFWLSCWLRSTLERFSKELRQTQEKPKSLSKKTRIALKLPSKGFAFWSAYRKEADLLLRQATRAAKLWQSNQSASTGHSRSEPPTLKAKDQILRNCIIIVGASVRYPPTSTLDLFRENAHLSDLMYLPYLDFGDKPLLLTDRMVIALSEEDRKRILGHKHLLVIGGPKVNVASRFLNDGFVFPFCFGARKKAFENLFDQLKERKALSNELAVGLFYEMLQVSTDIDPNDERFMKVKPRAVREKVRDEVVAFRERFTENDPLGYERIMKVLSGEKKFFDPLVQDLISPETTSEHLGVITLGKNYWANEPSRVCLLVAGIDTYGTTGALKALFDSDFHGHPLGGIVKAIVDTSVSEYDQFTSTVFQWLSPRYKVSDLIKELPKMQQDLAKPRGSIYEAFHGDSERFSAYKDFINRFQD